MVPANCPNPLLPSPPSLSPLPLLPPSETLEIHKRPESGGGGPAKLGVLPDSHSGGAPASMDGLAVEVRGSNGAFYKVTAPKFTKSLLPPIKEALHVHPTKLAETGSSGGSNQGP